MTQEFGLIRLRNGAYSIRAFAYDEIMHPTVGPAIEAHTLYVRQLQLTERIRQTAGEFVIWDVGMGGAANAVAVLNATQGLAAEIRVVSFDNTTSAAEFAIQHSEELPYVSGYESFVAQLITRQHLIFVNGKCRVAWDLHVADFTAFVDSVEARDLPRPDAILFDPFSPARNPAMWTLPLFESLFRSLDPRRPCSLATYSRSTATRVAMLLAGFFVGAGAASGLKEETTVAANRLDLLKAPLSEHWLQRALRSHSAEPFQDPVCRISPLTESTRQRLCAHPQFQSVIKS